MTITDLRPMTDEWTIDDLDALPHHTRAEVHNGNLVVMAPARLWHQHIMVRIHNLFADAGRHAYTEVGVVRLINDVRVADVGVFHTLPEDPEMAWHPADELSHVVEVWSPGSPAKDHDTQWYADLGIPHYWLAKPIKAEKWGALVTMFELRDPTGLSPAYVKTHEVTLAELEKESLG